MLVKKRDFLFFTFFILIISCKTEKTYVEPPKIFPEQLKNVKNADEDALRYWHHKDIVEDSIPGISLDRAYKTLLKNKKGNPIVVAVIDMEIAIDHEDLKNNIWTNSGEIPANGKDDDNNGYVDDINGWNFLGNDKGENVIHQNYEFVRIIKKFREVFQDKTIDAISKDQLKNFSKYQKAKEAYDEALKLALDDQKYGNFLVNTYPKSKALLKEFYPNEDYTVAQLDSLYNVYKDKDKEKGRLIYYMADYFKYNLTQKWINTYKKNADAKIEKILNLDYNDREIIGDNSDDINDISYGNNNVSGNAEKLYHGTVVTGVIAANRTNTTTGIKGIAEKVRIMPVCVSSNGDEHDKDIALAIRYAVDKDAKVINMSFRKDFSLHEEWVLEAIKYAAQKDVVLVVAAGNEGLDIDNKPSYPNDIYDQTEVAKNFIVVGASSFNTDENLMAYFSNYGKNNVDVFAPGEQIYTTYANNDYRYDTGTSMAAPMVSGVAALLRSYYPKLSAKQVKEIIMESGVSYNSMVNVPGTQGKEQKPFSDFSRSGRVVNAYNALLMAEKVAKQR